MKEAVRAKCGSFKHPTALILVAIAVSILQYVVVTLPIISKPHSQRLHFIALLPARAETMHCQSQELGHSRSSLP